MKYLFILNDQPYGTERSYNGVRLARELLKNKEAGNEVKVFLIGDAASCGKNNQKVPQGYYNLGQMLQMVAHHGAEIGVCGTCMDARGLADTDLVEGAFRGTMAELATWTTWADKVIVF
ncbi:MAG: hypothetical protein A3B81_02555 [Candidatus Muproteobacteria bacterium RIFCSPHIGHO2_02_FULL_65_16]|uniref:Uncharacterized protein n=1 Tax=Candidatus Muproteobacteria bacterium RIFCSPHIGHO2_02_FULL_65_16 TaxID=1817766 RepID=A0A1F6TTD0_9PROT|nr:MAG: hypothetical protein A3B81_02555 [Candidatus Muproteobacteria bacterium RIFCSPHIGHO2_02_FULL_65_16]